MFSCGRMPYPGVDAIDLPRLLDEGQRLDYPTNAANSSEMYVNEHYGHEDLTVKLIIFCIQLTHLSGIS